jgi:cohesin loading factor subunit SCC2
MPAIVAMETSPDPSFRETASLIHKKLNDKHASIIHGQTLDCIKQSFEYQCKLNQQPYPRGYRMNNVKMEERVMLVPEALLSSLQRLLQEKKSRRNEFMHTLVNVFELNLKTCKSESINLPLMKYVAENLATFDYKTNEEVLHVLHCVFRVLSTTGENCLAKIKLWNSGGVAEEEDEGKGDELALYAKASVAMGILFLLKNFLQELYQISES